VSPARLLPLLALLLLALAAPAAHALPPTTPTAPVEGPWSDPSEDGVDPDGGWTGDGQWTDGDGVVWIDADGDGWPDTTADPGEPGPPAPVTTPAPVVPTAPPVTRPSAPDLTLPLVTTATVKGRQAMLRRGGKAAIPRGAPLRVRRVIAAANRIVGKPYKWGGGHARLEDRGYDCSGTVSYALIRSGLLGYPMVSGTLATWGRGGAGKWITIYANKGHVYMEVAGLRLDTSPVMDPRGGSGPRWRPVIGKRQGFHVRHIAGL
jgi:hypothetical protein